MGAARRGVETTVLIPKKSNHIWADRAGRSYFEKLLQNKVRIFRYGGEMLHAKTVVIDGVWASVGSFNIDSLSIRFNYEANLVSTNEIFAQEVMEFFREDLILSQELLLSDWKARPWNYKLMEILSLPIRHFL
jgi:cardiolipin synthase